MSVHVSSCLIPYPGSSVIQFHCSMSDCISSPFSNVILLLVDIILLAGTLYLMEKLFGKCGRDDTPRRRRATPLERGARRAGCVIVPYSLEYLEFHA
jgi:hypothetical protein